MTDRGRRRQRQRRLALAGVVGAALAVASGMGVLWRKSEAARTQAVEAARQAEAHRLFALGQLEVDRNPTAAVAYSIASLEHDDTLHARLLALRALWRGPTAWAVAATDKDGAGDGVAFSPDGRWLTSIDERSKRVQLWERDGSGPRVVPFPGEWHWLNFSGDSRFLVLTQPREVLVYSLPAAELVSRTDESRFGFLAVGVVGGQDLVTVYRLPTLPDGRLQRLMKIRRLPDGEPETLGVWRGQPSDGTRASAPSAVDPVRQRFLWADGAGIYELPCAPSTPRRPDACAEWTGRLPEFQASPRRRADLHLGRFGCRKDLVAGHGGAHARASASTSRRTRTFWQPTLSGDGRWLAVAAGEAGALVSDLAGPIEAEPRSLRRDARVLRAAIDSDGSWLAVADERALTLWPLRGRHPHVLRSTDRVLSSVAIDPHGGWLVAAAEYVSGAARAWLWPLRPDAGAARIMLDTRAPAMDLAVSPSGDRLAVGTQSGAWLIQLEGGPPERLPGFAGVARGLVVRLSRPPPGGGRVRLSGPRGKGAPRLGSRDSARPGARRSATQIPVRAVAFLPDGRVLSSGGAIRLWDLATGPRDLGPRGRRRRPRRAPTAVNSGRARGARSAGSGRDGLRLRPRGEGAPPPRDSRKAR